jgi:hypothetical protein
VVSSGTSSDGVQASSQSLEARIASLHDEYLHMIQIGEVEEANKYISFLRRCVATMELVLELENG